MADSDLGLAVLRVTVDPREALAGLEAIRTQINRGFQQTSVNPFQGLEQQARTVGAQAGQAIRTAVQSATRGLSFGSISEALDFGGALNGSVRDLQEYRQALVNLRDGTTAAAPGFAQLNDVIAEVGQTIRNFSSSTDTLVRDLDRTRQAATSPELAQLGDVYRRLETSSRRAAAAQAELAGNAGAIEQIAQAAQAASPEAQRFRDILRDLQNTRLSVDTRTLQGLPDDARAAGTEILNLTRNLLNGNTAFANTTAGLREQATAFRTLASEVRFTTSEFTSFTRAAAKASQRELFAQFRELDALRTQFAIGRAAGPSNGINQDSFRGTEQLLDFANNRDFLRNQTPAALNLYIQALEQALAVTSVADDNFNRLTTEIDRQTAALNRATAAAAAFSRVERLTPDERRQVFEGLTGAARTAAPRALPSTELLAQRIASEAGIPVDRAVLPNRLSNTGINQTSDAVSRNLQQQIDAAQRFAANQRQNIQLQSDFNGVAEQTLRILRSFNDAISNGANLGTFLRELQASDRRISDRFRDNEIARGREIGRLNAVAVDGALPGGGFAPGSPRDRAQRAQRRRDAASNALIGGAFPLLFGQGIGASLGGGIGGGFGGDLGGQFGFGLSLVGTAVGAQVDRNFANLVTAGRALDAPVKRFSELSQAGLISSRSVERNVEALIATGREAEAAAAIQRDLATTLGDLDAARALANSTDDLNRAWNQLGTTMVAFTAGPLAALLNSINRPLQGLRGFFQDNFGTALQPDSRPGIAGFAGTFSQAGNRAAGLTTDILSFLGNPITTLLGAPRLSRSLGLSPRQAQQPPTPEQLDSSNAVRIRRDLLALTRQQNRAQAQGNDALATSLSLEISRRKERGALLNLSRTRRQGPEGDEIRQAGITEREQIVESALATANLSERELQNAKELSGVYGSQRDILERQQRLRTANRDLAQAEAAFARGRTGPDSAALQAQVTAARNARDRLALDNAEQDRLTRIDLALGDQQSRNRIADTQDRTALDRRRLGLSPERLQTEQARLDAISAQREARLAADAADARPGDEALLRAAREAAALSDAANERAVTAAKEYYRIITDAWRDVELQIASTDDNIAVQRQRRNLTGTGAGILQERANLADRRRQTLDLFRRAGRDPENERLQIEAVKASDNLRLASETFKANLIEAFQTAQRQALDLRRTLEDTNLAQSELQTDRDKGLNKFLRGNRETEGLFENQRQGVNRLLAPFEEARKRAVEFFLNQGNNDAARQIGEAANKLRDRGSRLSFEEQGALYRDFINRVNTETRLEEDVQQVQRDLVKVNNDLAVITKAATESTTTLNGSINELSKSVTKLTGKNWNVDVKVLNSTASAL